MTVSSHTLHPRGDVVSTIGNKPYTFQEVLRTGCSEFTRNEIAVREGILVFPSLTSYCGSAHFFQFHEGIIERSRSSDQILQADIFQHRIGSHQRIGT